MSSPDDKTPNVRMREQGFSPSEDRGGARWYSKQIEYRGRKALVAVKDKYGIGMPASFEEPVTVGIHDLKTATEIRSKRYESLDRYLDQLGKNPSRYLP